MSRVAERSDAGLRGAFVESGLQSDLAVAQLPRLFLGEFALVLVGHFWTEPRSRVLGVFLSLSDEQTRPMSISIRVKSISI